MSLSINFFRTLIPSVLNRNPTVNNSDLSRAIRCNIIGFKGHIQVSNRDVHLFQVDENEVRQKPVKVIYLSPYGAWLDVLVSIKRIFTGILFAPPIGNGDLRSDCLAQGRRITIFCALDGSEAELVLEADRKPLFTRLYEAAFSFRF